MGHLQNQSSFMPSGTLYEELVDVRRQLAVVPFAPKSMLCSVCATISVDRIFSPMESLIFKIGDAFQVQSRQQHCALCKICSIYLLRFKRDSKYHEWFAAPDPCFFQLYTGRTFYRAGSSDDDADWYFTRISLDVFLGPYTFIRLSKPSTYTLRHESPPQIFIQHRLAALGPSQLLEGKCDGRYLSRTSLQRIMNAAWDCKQNHRACDGTDHPGQAFTFRLINVLDRTVRIVPPAEQRPAYLALSYMWGKSTRHNYTELKSSSKDPDTRELPETLPQTVADTLKVVSLLGLQFVWIDAYCIDQSNPAELQGTISNMDSVYDSAFLTICPLWADSDAGLHGVSIPFQEYNQQPLGESYLCWEFDWRHPLDVEIVNTPWHRRGWIFQESLLSRQRLCFMPSSVLLICHEHTLSSHYYTKATTTPDPGAVSSDVQTRQCFQKSDWDFGAYNQIISNYAGRTLSHPSDALNAINGILSRISKNTGMKFVQALPQFDFLNGIMWNRNSFQIPEDAPWAGKVHSRRRFLFPSWSWLDYDTAAGYELWLSTPHEPSHSTHRILHIPPFDDRPTPLGSSFDVSVLSMAKVNVKKFPPQSSTLTIESEAVDIRLRQGLGGSKLPWKKLRWGPVHPRGETVMEDLQSLLITETHLCGMLIDDQIVPKLRIGDGICQVRLVLLARITRTEDDLVKGNKRLVGDTVIAMAINKVENSETAERLEIIAVPYPLWIESNPEPTIVNVI